MIVRLTQLDGRLPNLALMRLAAFHRSRGDTAVFTRSPYPQLDEPRYDRVYGSAIFSFSANRVAALQSEFPEAIVGGSWDVTERRPEDIVTIEKLDHTIPDALDYTDYPDFKASIGYTQRGCRLRCKFCVVPVMEGKPRSVGSIGDIWRGPGHPKQLHLLDNDFFGQPEWRDRIREIRDGQFKVCFNQGINIRMIDEEVAAALASVDYRDDSFKVRRLYSAWDALGDEARFFRGVDLLEAAGVRPDSLMAYMLVGFDPRETWARVMYRLDRMKERGIRPYPMIYGDRWRTLPAGGYNGRVAHKPLWQFQKWVIRRRYHLERFEDFDNAAYRGGGRGYRSPDQTDLFKDE